MKMTATTTSTWTGARYEDWITTELMDWVRHAPLEEDAIHNIKTIIKQYEKRYDRSKSFWNRLKALFV